MNSAWELFWFEIFLELFDFMISFFYRYEFCILCNCTFHEENPCRITRGCKMKNNSILAGNSNSNPTSPSSSTTSSTSGNYSIKARVSSKVSKRRLKRLWQNYFSQNYFYFIIFNSELYFCCTNYFFYKIDYNYRIL